MQGTLGSRLIFRHSDILHFTGCSIAIDCLFVFRNEAIMKGSRLIFGNSDKVHFTGFLTVLIANIDVLLLSY